MCERGKVVVVRVEIRKVSNKNEKGYIMLIVEEVKKGEKDVFMGSKGL